MLNGYAWGLSMNNIKKITAMSLLLLGFSTQQWATAKDGHKAQRRGPASVSALAPNGATRLGDPTRSRYLEGPVLPEMAASSAPSSEELSLRRTYPSILVQRNQRTVPRIGTLSPQFRHIDIAVQMSR